MAINKGPANHTEACLQHEITRLTGENFDLREKIENLNETIKRLRKQLKAYMRKLNEVGASLPADFEDANNTSSHSNSSNNNMQMKPDMPMIRKKEHDYLGMFEYKKEAEGQILKALIYDLKPKVAVQMLPGLPAYILFMMIRYIY